MLRTLSDDEVLVKAEAYTLRPDPGLPPSAIALIDELAWRLDRQLGSPSERDPYHMPQFKRGPNGRYTQELIPDTSPDRDEGVRTGALLADVRP